VLSAVPIPDRKVEAARERNLMAGEVPSPIDPPDGCALQPRCPQAMDICRIVQPELDENKPDHQVACHLYSEPKSFSSNQG
jgi:oligopeptide/dipeptide ABC transporter ATP-binding protein